MSTNCSKCQPIWDTKEMILCSDCFLEKQGQAFLQHEAFNALQTHKNLVGKTKERISEMERDIEKQEREVLILLESAFQVMFQISGEDNFGKFQCFYFFQDDAKKNTSGPIQKVSWSMLSKDVLLNPGKRWRL